MLDALCIAATESQILVSFGWVSLACILGSEGEAYCPVLAGFRLRDGKNSISTLLDRYCNCCKNEYPKRKVGAQISDMPCIFITETSNRALQHFRLKEAASKDLQLLVAGCKAAPSLVVGDVSLFKRFPEVHEAIQAAR